MGRVDSLKELTLSFIVRNRSLLGDLGDVDLDSAQRILHHCNVEQLRTIENETAWGGRDLSAVTASMWSRHFKRDFHREAQEQGTEQAAESSSSYWRDRYEAAEEARRRRLQATGSKLREMYSSHDDVKRKRQLQPCAFQPKRQRRSGGGGSAGAAVLTGARGRLMKSLGLTAADVKPVVSHEAAAAARRRASASAPAARAVANNKPSNASYASASRAASGQRAAGKRPAGPAAAVARPAARSSSFVGPTAKPNTIGIVSRIAKQTSGEARALPVTANRSKPARVTPLQADDLLVVHL